MALIGGGEGLSFVRTVDHGEVGRISRGDRSRWEVAVRTYVRIMYGVWHTCKRRVQEPLAKVGQLTSQLLSLWMGPLGFSQVPTYNRNHAFADLLSAAADTVGHSTI